MFSKHLSQVKSIKIGQKHLSDHAPIQMILKTGNEKGIWRYDDSFLSENDHETKERKRGLREYIMCGDTEEIHPVILREGAKVGPRGEIIADASFCTEQKEKARKPLERKIEEFYKVHKMSGEVSVLKNLKEAKAATSNFLNMEVENSLSMVRQRTMSEAPGQQSVCIKNLKNSKGRHQLSN